MQANFIQYVFLILIILALVMLANKVKIAYPIILVLGGLLLSFTSVFSHITIDSELVFFIFFTATSLRSSMANFMEGVLE
jgi:CPA1 family monovalent cation:H+ antiporter